MTAAVKAFLIALRDERVRNIIIGVLIGVLIIVLVAYSNFSGTEGNSSALAESAVQEYNYWQKTKLSDTKFSCQGEKYCKHFNSTVVDWCCYFVGYCIDEAELSLEDCGFSPRASVWVGNLKELNKLKNAGTYTPQKGNLIFFNYSGRSNYKATNKVEHIGIVVEINNDTITVVAGNEYNGETSNWATVSYVNKYTVNINSDNIACYGAVGTDVDISATKLNTLVRDIITHNEIGVMYSDIDEQYGNIIADDNGAITCGVYGWHGNRALELLREAYKLNQTEVTQILCSFNSGSQILTAIKTDTTWSKYIPNNNECICIKAVLLSPDGKEAQDTLALKDVQEYIDSCKENGLTDKGVIAYCSDILNQYGNYSFDSNGVLNGVNSSMSLDEVYYSKRAWQDRKLDYQKRRKWTYEYIKENLK